MMSFASLGEEAARPAPAAVPPPLPPKTRRPVSATALATGQRVGVSATPAPCASPPATGGEHVVKIRINPEGGSVRISVGPPEPEEMVQRAGEHAFLKQAERGGNPYFFCSGFPSSGMVMSSGQSSPSDTLDSGTCSDLDGSTPPPLPKKSGGASTVTVTVNGSGGGGHAHHRRTASLSSGAEPYSDEDAHSTISCDSLNGHELNGAADELGRAVLSNGHGHHHKHATTNGETIMESIQEEKLIPPPSSPLKSVALTVQANNLVNGTSSPKPPPPKTPAKPSVKPFVVGATMIQPPVAPPAPPVAPKPSPTSPTGPKTFLPQGLLQDIRDRSANLINGGGLGSARKPRSWDKAASPPATSPEPKEYPKNQSSLYRMLQQPRAASPEEPGLGPAAKSGIVQERTYEERARERSASTPEPGAAPGPRSRAGSYKYEEDRYYQFHLREHEPDPETEAARRPRTEEEDEEETFAGVKDLLGCKQASATIRSAKGTVRGVRNRVRAGIATFLHYPDTKNYKEKEAGKVVLYVTTMGIVRHTFQECLKVKKILRTLLVKYEERDAFMSREVQSELRERMHSDQVLVPQLFVEGQHIGDAETIERLNETGELRKMLKPFKSPDVCNTCQVCGGFRLLPCSICNGSKKSMHRNDFTAEFVALKCMSCDEVGLVKCYAC